MTRAQRRRAEREAKKGNKVVEQRITGVEESIRIALLKENIARDVDRKLYDKYYQKANKDAVGIILTSFGLALADTCPNWKAEAIAKRIQKTMDYVDKFSKEYDGDIERFMKELEDRTGFSFEIDSVSRKDE